MKLHQQTLYNFSQKVLKQQYEMLQNVIASYSGICKTVRLRVREQDLEVAKMFIKSSLKKD